MNNNIYKSGVRTTRGRKPTRGRGSSTPSTFPMISQNAAPSSKSAKVIFPGLQNVMNSEFGIRNEQIQVKVRSSNSGETVVLSKLNYGGPVDKDTLSLYGDDYGGTYQGLLNDEIEIPTDWTEIEKYYEMNQHS